MIPCLPESAAATGIETTLAHWVRLGWLRALDAAFAGLLLREAPRADPLLILAAALTSHQLGRGHVCLDLALVVADPAFALALPPEGVSLEADDEPPLKWLADIDLAQWLNACDNPTLVGDANGTEQTTPLVRSGNRLYLRRHWRYERDVETCLRRLAHSAIEVPASRVRAAVDTLFPDGGSHWQKLACALAVRARFAVITGGPGTGKTTTVVRLLALLQSLAVGRGERPLRIHLAAPTGKAAARLNESIAGALAQLPALPGGDAVRSAIPAVATTLHRLLGSRPDTRRFRHHAGNPLALDLLVVDEASMIDLEMMAALLAALPPAGRLILLGDRDQLASVEAGAVLSELCRRAAGGHYTPATAAWLDVAAGIELESALVDADGTDLDQSIAMLRRSHRFDGDSGIGRLAAAVNAGDVAAAQMILAAGDHSLAQLDLRGGEQPLRSLVLAGGSGDRPGRCGYRHYLQTLHGLRPAAQENDDAAFDAWALAVLRAHAEFQLLCAPRQGPWGVAGLNQRITAILLEAGLISATDGWYEGRPVLVTRNDYGLKLVNGDIGIALRRGGRLLVAFAEGQRLRWLLPSRLPAVETVYALTVHKSQGSEFGHAALVVPPQVTPLLTRELLYTGITRARRYLTLALAGDAQVVAEAVRRPVQRASGLLQENQGS